MTDPRWLRDLSAPRTPEPKVDWDKVDAEMKRYREQELIPQLRDDAWNAVQRKQGTSKQQALLRQMRDMTSHLKQAQAEADMGYTNTDAVIEAPACALHFFKLLRQL